MRLESAQGSRGGNVRDLDEARGLQEEQKEKARWTLIVREQIIRTLLGTGYLHADDLDDLGVPPAHCNVRGSQMGSFRSCGYMEKTGVERKVSHAAANGRKAPIYRITAKGRRELPRLLKDLAGSSADVSSLRGDEGVCSTPLGVSTASGDEGSSAGPPQAVRQLPAEESARPFEPMTLIEDERPPSAYDPFSEAA